MSDILNDQQIEALRQEKGDYAAVMAKKEQQEAARKAAQQEKIEAGIERARQQELAGMAAQEARRQELGDEAVARQKTAQPQSVATPASAPVAPATTKPVVQAPKNVAPKPTTPAPPPAYPGFSYDPTSKVPVERQIAEYEFKKKQFEDAQAAALKNSKLEMPAGSPQANYVPNTPAAKAAQINRQTPDNPIAGQDAKGALAQINRDHPGMGNAVPNPGWLMTPPDGKAQETKVKEEPKKPNGPEDTKGVTNPPPPPPPPPEKGKDLDWMPVLSYLGEMLGGLMSQTGANNMKQPETGYLNMRSRQEQEKYLQAQELKNKLAMQQNQNQLTREMPGIESTANLRTFRGQYDYPIERAPAYWKAMMNALPFYSSLYSGMPGMGGAGGLYGGADPKANAAANMAGALSGVPYTGNQNQPTSEQQLATDLTKNLINKIPMKGK